MDGNAPIKHVIIRFPPTDGPWFILRCDEHETAFKSHPLRGAAAHWRSSYHGHQWESSAEVLIQHFGVEVIDCDEALAEKNNAVASDSHQSTKVPRPQIMRHRAARRQFLLERGKTPKLQIGRHARSWSGGGRESLGKQQRKQHDLGGIPNPTAGRIYLAYHEVAKHWLPALILPQDGLDVGLPMTLQDLGLLDHVPACYTHDSEDEDLEWRDGYEDDGPLVMQRRFPAIYFDGFDFPEESSVGWACAGDLQAVNVFDSSLSLIPNLKAARDFIRRRLRAKADPSGPPTLSTGRYESPSPSRCTSSAPSSPDVMQIQTEPAVDPVSPGTDVSSPEMVESPETTEMQENVEVPEAAKILQMMERDLPMPDLHADTDKDTDTDNQSHSKICSRPGEGGGSTTNESKDSSIEDLCSDNDIQMDSEIFSDVDTESTSPAETSQDPRPCADTVNQRGSESCSPVDESSIQTAYKGHHSPPCFDEGQGRNESYSRVDEESGPAIDEPKDSPPPGPYLDSDIEMRSASCSEVDEGSTLTTERPEDSPPYPDRCTQKRCESGPLADGRIIPAVEEPKDSSMPGPDFDDGIQRRSESCSVVDEESVWMTEESEDSRIEDPCLDNEDYIKMRREKCLEAESTSERPVAVDPKSRADTKVASGPDTQAVAPNQSIYTQPESIPPASAPPNLPGMQTISEHPATHRANAGAQQDRLPSITLVAHRERINRALLDHMTADLHKLQSRSMGLRFPKAVLDTDAPPIILPRPQVSHMSYPPLTLGTDNSPADAPIISARKFAVLRGTGRPESGGETPAEEAQEELRFGLKPLEVPPSVLCCMRKRSRSGDENPRLSEFRGDDGLFHCPWCPKLFARGGIFADHLASKHEKDCVTELRKGKGAKESTKATKKRTSRPWLPGQSVLF
ncbi:hypothetical protein ACJ41O_005863 [Fusarium nematophilum]